MIEPNSDLSLPATDHLFHPATESSSVTVELAATEGPLTKKPGGGDSGKKRSSVKAPGGKDASRQKDGG